MDIIGLWVSTRELRDIHLFRVSPSFKNCPSARRAIAINSDYFDVGVFIRQIITLGVDNTFNFITKFVLMEFLIFFFIFFKFHLHIVFCLFTCLRFSFCIIVSRLLIHHFNKEEMDESELTEIINKILVQQDHKFRILFGAFCSKATKIMQVMTIDLIYSDSS